MADRQMLALKEDSDTVLSNSDSSREAVKLYFQRTATSGGAEREGCSEHRSEVR